MSAPGIYSLYRYDRTYRLKISPMLWLALIYGVRHLLLLVVMRMPGVVVILGDWGELQGSLALLASDVLVVLVLWLAGRRMPKAHAYIRTWWHYGRWLLMSAYALDLLVFAYLQHAVLIHPDHWNFPPAVGIVLADLVLLTFLARSKLVRDIFADYPEVTDSERTRVPHKQENTI